MIVHLLFLIFVSGANEFPVCEDLFSELDTAIENPSTDVEAAKKKLFKTANDKRTEVVRYVRFAKNEFRKSKDEELKAFDLEVKKNAKASAEVKKQDRAARTTLTTKIANEKKEFNREISDKEKACHKYLSEKRDFYLAKLRDIQHALKQTPKNTVQKTLIPDVENEFDTIPKGPGTVLKPQ